LGAELIGWGALKQQKAAALSRMNQEEKPVPLCPLLVINIYYSFVLG
jgi:hypothetical protein